MARRFPFLHQLSVSDCGPTCLRMVSAWHGRKLSSLDLDTGSIARDGLSLGELERLAQEQGFETALVKTSYDALREKAPLPAIVHWNQNHYAVVYKMTADKVWVADPAHGKLKYTREEFMRGWLGGTGDGGELDKGVALLAEPGADFQRLEGKLKPPSSWGFIRKYFLHYKLHLGHLMLGLFLGSLLQFASPFLTRSIVDYGIGTGSTSFLVLIFGVQIALFILNIGIEFLRTHLLLHISSRINILLISDFLVKMMKLPLGFFSYRITGDLVQRIRDHDRVERFISGALLRSIFSAFSLVVFSIVLYVFSPLIFGIFAVGLTLELAWIFYFMRQIEQLDHKGFALHAEDQNKVFELISGIQDIKLNNIEDKKRWEWERVQVALFGVSLRRLKVNQFQEGGQRFLSYLQIILITICAAYLTIQGDITLGTMMAVIFVVGQMNAPVSQLINFILQGQLAKLSLDRLVEVQGKAEEVSEALPQREDLPADRSLRLAGVGFSYHAHGGRPVLEDLDLDIPAGKVTAIVGVSGSGKTTLLKLLLKFYDPLRGSIQVGGEDLATFAPGFWRGRCGAVLQDSFIFSDTIAQNIALVESDPEALDYNRLVDACAVANLLEFIESLPLGFQTKVGPSGVGLSQGQKQRLLIARAVYKDPDYLFFDEATNALDADNEKIITDNLAEFYAGKTVIVVAHRLSTVRNADQIIVLDQGRIAEQGSHQELVALGKKYFHLIKNQLELGV